MMVGEASVESWKYLVDCVTRFPMFLQWISVNMWLGVELSHYLCNICSHQYCWHQATPCSHIDTGHMSQRQVLSQLTASLMQQVTELNIISHQSRLCISTLHLYSASLLCSLTLLQDHADHLLQLVTSRADILSQWKMSFSWNAFYSNLAAGQVCGDCEWWLSFRRCQVFAAHLRRHN